MDREYFQFSVDEIETVTEAHWDESLVLFRVLLELLYRRTARARDLRAEVVERLRELVGQGFPWPATDASPGDGDFSDPDEWPERGMLGYLGYKVGKSGLQANERQGLLDSVFIEKLPPLNSPEYMRKWGAPATSQRLKQMADSIAAHCRNAKRNDPESRRLAISEWEEDLEYLCQTYYVGKYDFVWPTTEFELNY